MKLVPSGPHFRGHSHKHQRILLCAWVLVSLGLIMALSRHLHHVLLRRSERLYEENIDIEINTFLKVAVLKRTAHLQSYDATEAWSKYLKEIKKKEYVEKNRPKVQTELPEQIIARKFYPVNLTSVKSVENNTIPASTTLKT